MKTRDPIRPAMGHHWSAGVESGGDGDGTTMRCVNGRWARCGVTWADHRRDPKPCALTAWTPEEEAA